MDLTIEQSCPSCGAPVNLHEDDRLIQCGFCDIKNYMVVTGPLRFVLPAKVPDTIRREDFFYIPYLRFKGHIFTCQGREVGYKIIDTTHLGVKLNKLPVSLGLRPQAMKVIPATANISGRFVRLTEKPNTIFSKAALLTSAFSKTGTQPLYHRAFIGETVSYLYLPTYRKDDILFDAVLNREIGDIHGEDMLFHDATPFRKNWEPHFLSTNCPHCADALVGEHDSLALICSNCLSVWQEREGRFHRIDWEVIASKRGDSCYLPFWKITPEVSGIDVATFADFLRLTNHPVTPQEEYESIPLTFWVPAFKIRPKFLLHLAKRLTLTQTAIPKGEQQPLSKSHPVTLPLSEAMQALKSIFAKSGLNKKKMFPQLPNIFFKAKQTTLTFLPFNDRGHDFVQEQTGVNLAKSILRFARHL